MELRIDPEFRDKIPPLTQEEFDQLRDNILEDGEIYEPIAVWNGVIVDGHNRWKIYQEHPGLPEPKIAEKHFHDKYEAFAWMYKKQLGRRNLTEEQRTILIGRTAMAQMKSHGGDRGTERDENGMFTASGQNDTLRVKDRTRDIVARELGVGTRTVDRAVKFTKGIDAIREDSPEVADKILQGGTRATKTLIMEYPEMGLDDKRLFVDAVKSGERPKNASGKPVGFNQEMRKLHAEINAIANDMCDPDSTPEYALSDLTTEIKENGEAYIRQLTRTLNDRKELYAGNAEAQDEVSEAITTVIIEKINNLMEGVINA